MQQGFPIMDKILMFNKYMISEGVFTSPMSGYTNAFAGGNCALKTKDALRVGGFDTRYRDNAFREESDMSMKMISNNMKIYYQPKAELLHLAAPRGGNRVAGDIWDNFGTYKNELFFTFRYVRLRDWIMALRIKRATYCTSEKPTVQRRRRRLFIMAIPFAFARFFMPQITAKETKA